MRIAIVAPLIESVPPTFYGGTERIISYLTEELVRLGHIVTLYAAGSSTTTARLVSGWPRALRGDPFAPIDVAALDALSRDMMEHLTDNLADYDVVQFHTHVQFDLPHFRTLRRGNTPFVTTLHGRLDALPFYCAHDILKACPRTPLVSISEQQRAPLPDEKWLATVLHGIPLDLLTPQSPASSNVAETGYLAFLGRICPEKSVDVSIRVSRAAGIPLHIAAKVDPVDETYFADFIAPLLGSDAVHIGEIGDADKAVFLSGARALLLTIDWPEPFGLVMIEAMACGTPVVAFRAGAVPEVVEDGLTGYIVETEEEAVAALGKVGRSERGAVREV